MKLEGFRITDLSTGHHGFQGPLTTKVRIISTTSTIDIASSDPAVRKWAESLCKPTANPFDEVLTVEISK